MGRPIITFTPEQQVDLKSRYAAGEGLAILAAEYGIAVATMSRKLREMGVAMRGKGRPRKPKLELPAPDPKPIEKDPEEILRPEHRSSEFDDSRRFEW